MVERDPSEALHNFTAKAKATGAAPGGARPTHPASTGHSVPSRRYALEFIISLIKNPPHNGRQEK
jgi:hypothetical protein